MRFIAKALYLPYSPYKLRPIANVLRGKPLLYALNWLQTYKTKRAVPLKKAIESAAANAKNRQGLDKSNLIVKEICIDQGPVYKYFKPGAMGRAMILRRRMCHINVALEEKKLKQEENSGTQG